MEGSLLTLEQVHLYLLQNNGKVRNRDIVRHFKSYLTDSLTKDENRSNFKSYINTLAITKIEGDEKIVQLKEKYSSYDPLPRPTYSFSAYSPTLDPRNAIGIPVLPSELPIASPQKLKHTPTGRSQTNLQKPPPYRNPPPVNSSASSLNSSSFGSLNSLNESVHTPLAPPREKRRDSEKCRSICEDVTPKKEDVDLEDKTISVKERTQKFNRLASIEDELSPRHPKSAEKENRKPQNWGADHEDGLNLIPLEPKKCMEWYVTASRGDYQELLKLANNEPRLVSKKATVLHWGAKYGNAEIIKTFAGKYKVDVNGKTNGGYTPLHISAQFGHKDVFKLLIEVYKADPRIRDYSGRTADYYFRVKEQKQGQTLTMRKLKGRKKQSDKEGFLRIGSLNVRVKKTTEAFSNFLGVGSGANITPLDPVNEKMLKGWGSVDNVNKEGTLKNYGSKKKSKKGFESGGGSTPSTPRTPTKNFHSLTNNDSDSDTAAGFDSNWKN